MRVAWTRPAHDQLAEILAYVSECNAKAANRLAVEIDMHVRALGVNPYRGRAGRLSGTRELVLPGLPYVLAYRVTDRVEILAIMHGARQWPEKF